jgi:hypothetical protein
MDFNEYQKAAVSTAIYREAIDKVTTDTLANKLLKLAYVGLGMGESGEVQGKIKKLIRDSGGVITPEIKQAIVGELGGLLWYVAACADELDIALDYVARYNVDQLRSRADRGVLKGSGDNR